jgi:hypothetical protein
MLMKNVVLEKSIFQNYIKSSKTFKERIRL